MSAMGGCRGKDVGGKGVRFKFPRTPGYKLAREWIRGLASCMLRVLPAINGTTVGTESYL